MPDYKNYAIVAKVGADFDNEIDYYLRKDTSTENASIRTFYPDRIVTKSAEDNLLSIPNIKFYELTKDEAAALEGFSSIKAVHRHFSDEETIVKYNGFPTASFSQSLDLFLKSGSEFPDFYSLVHFEETDDPNFTGSITSSRLIINAPFYSASQEAFWYNGGEEIFLNSSSYSQSFLDAFIEASMSWDNSSTNSPSPDGENYIGLTLNGLITPWYLENKPAVSNVNGEPTPFGGGGLGYYNITPTVNQRWRRSYGNDDMVAYYTEDWPGGILDSTGQMTNWGLYAHTTPKEEFDWRIMYQLDTNSASMDEYGNFPLKSTSVQYNFTATGKNVDLMIMDTGVNTEHPEFKYYDPEYLGGSGGWRSRVQRTDWTTYCPSITGSSWYDNSKTFISQYYDNLYLEHGTSVASNAAGRTQGWAKEAKIYDLRIFGSPKLTILQAFQCILNFHNSKPINPSTGFKDPTVVNMSWSYYNMPISISQWFNSEQILAGWADFSKIKEIYYKGVSVYPDYTGSKTTYGTNVYNLMPGHDQSIHFEYSESYGTYASAHPYRRLFQAKTTGYAGTVEELQQQCVDAGVIFVAAAGNSSQISVKTGSKYEGVEYDHRGLWDSTIVKEPTSGSGYYLTYPINIISTPALNESVITVGALAPNIVIDKGTDLLTGSLKTSGSRAYDMFGEESGCWRVFGGYGSPKFVKSTEYNIPQFEHSDMHQIMGTSQRVAKRGLGVGDVFPGWEAANSSSYFALAFFSNKGNAVDIWAAGYQVAVARMDIDQIVSEATGYGLMPTKHVRNSLAHFQYPFQSGYYFLGNPDYPSYYRLYPQASPPSRITQQAYRIQAGTSFASPNVAGVVCLFMELNPGATSSQVKKFLIEQGQKAMPIWVDNPNQNYADFTGSMKTEMALANGKYPPEKITPIVDTSSVAPSSNRDIGIYGAEPVMLYWPYTNRKNKLNNITLTNS